MNVVTPVPAPVATPFFALTQRRLLLLTTTALISLLSFDNWTLFNTPTPDYVDGSWSIALNLARNLHLRFGTDVAFTYGPLGFLTSTRLPIATQPWEMLAYDGWLLVQTGFVIWVILKDRFTVVNTLSVVGLVLFMHNADGGEAPFVLFFFSLFLLCYHLKVVGSPVRRYGSVGLPVRRYGLVGVFQGGTALLLYAGAISLFTFYIKVSVGLASVGCYVLYVLYWAVTRRQGIVWLIVILAISLSGLIVSAWLLRTDLVPYVLTSLQIINSYNDVMVLMLGSWSLLSQFFVAVAALGSFGLLVMYWATRQSVRQMPMRDTSFMILLAAVSLFILFKQGFVRADPSHAHLFYKYAALPLTLLIGFAQPAWFRHTMRILLVILVGYRVLGMPFSFAFNQPAQVAMYARSLFKPTDYGSHSARLPQRWQQLIRPASVDVIPDAIGLLYANQLTAAYRPRPVFQSYQVTNRYLDSMNAAAYRSTRGPAYLIYTQSAIDERYAFADEARTKIAMLQHYAVADQQRDWVLLRRRAIPMTVDTVAVTTRIGRLGESIPVPAALGVQLAQIGVHYSWLGRLTRLLFQPPAILLEMELENGQRMVHRIGRTLLENGLISNRYVKNNADYVRYMQSAGYDGQAIRAIRIVPRRWTWGFEPSFSVVFTQLSFGTPTTGVVAQRLNR